MKSRDRASAGPALPTCGYMEETGLWSIDLDFKTQAASAEINSRARREVQSFLDAFRDICRGVEGRYEAAHIGADGRIDETKEGQFAIAELGPLRSPRIPVLGSSEDLVTTVFVTCDTLVTLPCGPKHDQPLWLPGSCEFYLGNIVTSEDSAAPRLTRCRISFETSIDIWVQTTRDPSSWEWRDNSDFAVHNEPKLEVALTTWEHVVGSPIVEWTSRHYKEQITRYGFKS